MNLLSSIFPGGISPLVYVVAVFMGISGVQTWRLDSSKEELAKTEALLKSVEGRYASDLKLLTTSIKGQNAALQQLADSYAAIDTQALSAIPELARSQARDMAKAQVSMLKAINGLKTEDSCDTLMLNYKKLLQEIPK